MLLAPIQQIFEQIPMFVLVMFRMAGLIVLAPLMGSVTVPNKVKVLMVLVLSMAIFPLVPPIVYAPNSLLGLSVAVAGEMLIGISIGFVLLLLFVGIQFGAEMVSYQMGFSMAQLIDPMTDISTTVLSQFYLLLGTLLYVLMDGHLILIKSLAQTFQTIPLLGGFNGLSVLKVCVVVITEAFKLGIRIAGPALVALFLEALAMGFISRTMPQLNILAAGFPIRIILALVLLLASMCTVLMLFQESLVMVFHQIGLIFI